MCDRNDVQITCAGCSPCSPEFVCVCARNPITAVRPMEIAAKSNSSAGAVLWNVSQGRPHPTPIVSRKVIGASLSDAYCVVSVAESLSVTSELICAVILLYSLYFCCCYVRMISRKAIWNCRCVRIAENEARKTIHKNARQCASIYWYEAQSPCGWSLKLSR